MTLELREIREADRDDCARIVYEAFKAIADRHGFPPDFGSVEAAGQLIDAWLAHPDVWGVVAQRDGQVVGSNFLEMRTPIAGVGPITVDPREQSRGVGRRLMEAVLEQGERRPIRLVQDAFNAASLSLYSMLGFEVKDPLVRIHGEPSANDSSSIAVRPFESSDMDGCAQLCQRVHGFERSGELREVERSPLQPFVGVRDGRIVAYATSITFWPLAHGVAETREDLIGLLAEAQRSNRDPIDILLPIRDAELFRWALSAGLRVVKPMNLMALRDYREPAGAWFPSVLF
ncbi:MAG: GNAT family N-acetyltransferase [Solirubrobacteraceae bacterium]|jgi:GNAT superfamily N-acetyltransferase